MLEIIGASLGFWLLYALIAIFAKHKAAIITTAILGLIAGISACAARGDYVTLVGSALAVVLILVITPLQINSEKKEEWKKSKLNNQNNNKNSKNDILNQSTNSTSKNNNYKIENSYEKEDLSNIVNSMDFDLSLDEIKKLQKDMEQYTRDNLPQMFEDYKTKKDKESIVRIMKTFICMYSHAEDIYLGVKSNALLIINTAFGRYLPVYTNEKFLYKETFTNCNKISFRKILETFYTLNECNMCEGIVINYGADNMMLFPKVTLDNCQFDLFFDVPWKKK